MKLLVAGSRDWDNIKVLHTWISHWTKHVNDVTLIEGGCRGADRLARDYGLAQGWEIHTFLPKYDQHGKRATHIRNQAMVDENPDLVLIFWRNRSAGTKSTITKAFQAGLFTRVCYYEDYE